MKDPTQGSDLTPLVELVAHLRGPAGCPWDREQTLPDLRAYLLEEAHEVAAAIDSREWKEVEGELGDLLFQIVFISSLAEDAGAFDIGRVIEGILHKMISRHPHVFGGERLVDAKAVNQAWERSKAERDPRESILDGVAPSLPALLAAYRMTQKAAGVGFDWAGPREVLAKVDEELAELRKALGIAEGSRTESDDDPESRRAVREEVGDLLFTVANLARKLGIDPEAALAEGNAKFRRRFAHIEKGLRACGHSLADATLDEMEELWVEAKGERKT